MINLPFLKRRKTPRSQEPQTDKMVGLSGDEELEDQCIEEMMEACANKDAGQFRSALEALVMCAFEYEDQDAAYEG